MEVYCNGKEMIVLGAVCGWTYLSLSRTFFFDHCLGARRHVQCAVSLDAHVGIIEWLPINDHVGIKLWMPLQFVLDALQEKRTSRYVHIIASHLSTILLNFDYILLTHSRDQAQLSNTLTVNQTNNKQYQEPAQTFLQNLIIFNYIKSRLRSKYQF